MEFSAAALSYSGQNCQHEPCLANCTIAIGAFHGIRLCACIVAKQEEVTMVLRRQNKAATQALSTAPQHSPAKRPRASHSSTTEHYDLFKLVRLHSLIPSIIT